jgi:hypothetical protein
MPCRLKVGRETLNLAIGVRIPARQPFQGTNIAHNIGFSFTHPRYDMSVALCVCYKTKYAPIVYVVNHAAFNRKK